MLNSKTESAMKKVSFYISAAIIALGFSSCDLDSVSMKEADTSNFPVTSEQIDQTLAGVYQNLNEINKNPQESFHYWSLLASDDMLGGGGLNDKLMQACDLLCNYGTNMTENFWKARYEGINRANTVIEALETVEMDETKKAQALGEAKFLRAFYYYELASMYGRVPLNLSTANPENTTPPSAATIWGQILQDLYEAATTMPAQRLTNGHVDKYGAEAMLGRAWLFYTGFYCNGEDIKDLTSTNYSPLAEVALPNGTTLTKKMVSDLIDDCVANGKAAGYQLLPDYRELWAYTNKYTVEDFPDTKGQNLKWAEDDNQANPESMFAIKFNKTANWNAGQGIGPANGYALHFGVRGGQPYADTFPFGQGWGAGPVAPNLVNDWKVANPKNTDVREDASVKNVNDMPAYKHGGASWADFIQETDYYQMKLGPVACKTPVGSAYSKEYMEVFELAMYGLDGWLNDNYMQTGNIRDLVLIRYADVLLMQSELEENVAGMNEVHKRATGVANYYTSYSLADLQKERRWELAFEGTRWNDIRRWHIAAAALEKQTNQPIYTAGAESKNVAQNGGYTTRYNATAGFAKIPENQITLNHGMLQQNAGYTDASGEYNGWKE